MFSVVFSEKAYAQLDGFIDSFKWVFVKMYTDTWIFDEALIQNSYIELWDRFNDLIVDNINNTFVQETLFWISKTESGLLFITISINNFRLFVYYSEDRESKIRFIEDIEFFKK
jgi:hypothetical protein